MPYNFSKDEPRDPESMSSDEWRFLRRVNVFMLLAGLVPVSWTLFDRIQKNDLILNLILVLLFVTVWVVFFAQNIGRATSWMRSAKRKESQQQSAARK